MLVCDPHFSGKSAINKHPNWACGFTKICSKAPIDFYEA